MWHQVAPQFNQAGNTPILDAGQIFLNGLN